MTRIETGFVPQPRTEIVNRQSGKIMQDIDRAQQELVSGLRADPVLALAGRTGETLALQARLSDLETIDASISLSSARASAQQSAIGTMRDALIDFVNTSTVATQSGLTNFELLSSAAEGTLRTVVGALNTTFGGRPLFGGDGLGTPVTDATAILSTFRLQTAAAPDPESTIAMIAQEFDTAGTMFDTEIYRGGTGSAPATTTWTGEPIRIDVKASEPVFRNVLRDLVSLAVSADPSRSFSTDGLREAFEQVMPDLRSAADELTDRSASIGAAEAQLAKARTQNSAERAYLVNMLADRVGRDRAETATEIIDREGKLEALFLATARLSRLSLTSFIR